MEKARTTPNSSGSALPLENAQEIDVANFRGGGAGAPNMAITVSPPHSSSDQQVWHL